MKELRRYFPCAGRLQWVSRANFPLPSIGRGIEGEGWKSIRRCIAANSRRQSPSGKHRRFRPRVAFDQTTPHPGPPHEPLFERANFGNSNAFFPLTPALSPGERENGSPVLCQSAVSLCSESGITCLPLPRGEGRGEGERDVLRHDSCPNLRFRGAQRAKTSGNSLPVEGRGRIHLCIQNVRGHSR